MYIQGAVTLVSLGLVLSDKSPDKAGSKDSYENGVGTSFTVPLNPAVAKAVTKTLEKVRSFLREQCLSPTPHYTEDIHENLKIFDKLFSEFEFSYVSCMVHVKTVKGRNLSYYFMLLLTV